MREHGPQDGSGNLSCGVGTFIHLNTPGFQIMIKGQHQAGHVKAFSGPLPCGPLQSFPVRIVGLFLWRAYSENYLPEPANWPR